MPSDRERWAKAFEYCMQQLTGVYGREFNHPAMKAYMEACEGWSIERMQEAFRRAIAAEKFCPTVATLAAYGAGVRDEYAPPVVQSYKQPQYTPEEVANIKAMIRDLQAKGISMPWHQPLPTGWRQ